MTSEENEHINQWAPSVVLKVPVGTQCNAHVEYFGIHSDRPTGEKYLHFVSPRVHYLVTPDLEIGVRL